MKRGKKSPRQEDERAIAMLIQLERKLGRGWSSILQQSVGLFYLFYEARVKGRKIGYLDTKQEIVVKM